MWMGSSYESLIESDDPLGLTSNLRKHTHHIFVVLLVGWIPLSHTRASSAACIRRSSSTNPRANRLSSRSPGRRAPSRPRQTRSQRPTAQRPRSGPRTTRLTAATTRPRVRRAARSPRRSGIERRCRELGFDYRTEVTADSCSEDRCAECKREHERPARCMYVTLELTCRSFSVLFFAMYTLQVARSSV